MATRSTPAVLEVTVRPPAGFVPLPLDDDDVRRNQRARDLAERVHEAADMSAEEFTEAALMVADRVRRFGVRLAGRFPVDLDGEPALASLVLAVQPLDPRDPVAITRDRSSAAGTLQELFQGRHPNAETNVIELPCGPAMAGVMLGEYRIPPERTGRDEEVVIGAYRAQFQILAPTGEHLVVLEISTQDRVAWPATAEAAINAARSLTFTDADSGPSAGGAAR